MEDEMKDEERKKLFDFTYDFRDEKDFLIEDYKQASSILFHYGVVQGLLDKRLRKYGKCGEPIYSNIIKDDSLDSIRTAARQLGIWKERT